ncbi:hypothetical protein FRB94_010389 [Tulasnella sp. JGI-2019a]|nr:hypothetical protein FRB94_010389 [Tulasnella sp. JGI-2019a]
MVLARLKHELTVLLDEEDAKGIRARSPDPGSVSGVGNSRPTHFETPMPLSNAERASLRRFKSRRQ